MNFMNKNIFSFAALLVFLSFTSAVLADEKEKDVAPGTYKAYMVFNAHFDSQYTWDVKASISEYLPRTLFQNLYIMERYPDYKFNFEGGIKYAWMKEYYPLHYRQIQKYIDSGQWHISGSSWDANDTNIPSPESAFRNILLGQEFFKKEFGVKSTDIFLPDCFGFSSTLPTIAAHCSLIGMSASKLNSRKQAFYDDEYFQKVPLSWGEWKGIDGNSVIAAFDTGGYPTKLPERPQYDKKITLAASKGFENTCFRYYFCGIDQYGFKVGDRGGSGTVESCRWLADAIADKSAPVEIISAHSDDLFLKYKDRKSELPCYEGELLMDVHGTGCYTSHTEMKYLNRRNEMLAGAAETASVAAEHLGVLPYDKITLDEIWKRFIWHQFHDDLTGTTLPESYTYSWNDELICLRQSTDVMSTAVSALSGCMDTRAKGISLLVYNPIASRVKGIVEAAVVLNDNVKGVVAYGPDGTSVPVQIVERNGGMAKILFVADVPSAGYAVYDIRPGSVRRNTQLKFGANFIENSIYRVTLDANGDILSIIDKRFDRELVKESMAFRLGLIEGNPSYTWPAWEILKDVIDKPSRPIDGDVRISVAEQGPVRASLRIDRICGESSYTQYVSLSEGAASDRIDIRSRIDWHNDDALLKAEFPMSVASPEATYDLGLASIRRGNNTNLKYEVPAQKWADITAVDGSYGITIMNDCKHGWDKPSDDMLRLTLIHTPSIEKRLPYQHHLDNGINEFTYSIVGHKGNLDHAYASASAEELNLPLVAFEVPKHKGGLGKSFSMLSSSTPDLKISALKKAEDGDGYIVRCFNLKNDVTEGELIFPTSVLSAEECNGIEERISSAVTEGNAIKVRAERFAPKTYRVRLASKERKTLDRGCPVALPYNAVAFTTDEFYTFYKFDKLRGTYAAELIPDTLSFKGIDYVMGEENYPDFVRCAGQTIKIPTGYDKLYLLVSAADKDCKAEFTVGDVKQTVDIPLWKGFYGQWGRYGNPGYMKEAELAYVGSHRHQGPEGNLPYDFSYMYKVELNIPAGAETIVFPDNSNVSVFAMTAVDGVLDEVRLISETFKKPE